MLQLLPELMLRLKPQPRPMLMPELATKLANQPIPGLLPKPEPMPVLSHLLELIPIIQPVVEPQPIMPIQPPLDQQSIVHLALELLAHQQLVAAHRRQLKAINSFARAVLDSNQQ